MGALSDLLCGLGQITGARDRSSLVDGYSPRTKCGDRSRCEANPAGLASNVMIRLTVTAASAALVVGLLSLHGTHPARAATAFDRVIATDAGLVTQLGPWKVMRDPSLRRATRLFGKPQTRRRLSAFSDRYVLPPTCGWTRNKDTLYSCVCLLRWTSPQVGRVSAWFEYVSKHDFDDCSGTGQLTSFSTSDPSWRTDRNIRVGSPTSMIRSAYPCPRFSRSSLNYLKPSRPPKGTWILTSSSAVPTTWAVPTAGRVASLTAAFYPREEIGLGGECPPSASINGPAT